MSWRKKRQPAFDFLDVKKQQKMRLMMIAAVDETSGAGAHGGAAADANADGCGDGHVDGEGGGGGDVVGD